MNAGRGFHCEESSATVYDGFRIAGVFRGNHDPISIPTVADREIDLKSGKELCNIFLHLVQDGCVIVAKYYFHFYPP